MLSLMMGLSLLLCPHALAVSTVGTPGVSPATIPAGQAIQLTVTSQITTGPTDPPVISTSVNLLRLDAQNKVIATLGTMRDDGTNGDAIGGDKIFTLRLTVTEQNPGEMRLQVSAAFLKTLKRVLSDIVVIPVLLPPMPPILNPIGNQTVALGSTLTLNLTASDPNNDPLAFSATPLPLPDNASLNAMTGSFTFSPAANQVGDILLTFTVSDGVFSDSETVTIYRSGSAARRRHRADRTHPGYQ